MKTRKLNPPSSIQPFSGSIQQKSSKISRMTAALERIHSLENEMGRVIREMQEKVRQLECLNDFSGVMNSTLDAGIVRTKALEAICSLLGCEVAVVLLVDSKTGELFSESSLPLEAEEVLGGGQFREIRLPMDDQSIAGRVAMTGEGMIVNDFSQNAQSLQKTAQILQIHGNALVSVPLKTKGRVIGVVEAWNKLPQSPPRSSGHPWPDFFEEDRRLLETFSHSISTALENSQLYYEIKKNFFETVEALAEAIEKKDHYTGGHTKRVVHYSVCIAKYMEMTAQELENIRLAAILHDIGKIGIEDKILKKASALEVEEWKVMQTHPNLGYEILARVEGLNDVIGGTRYHHERWDGKGYPVGLKGEEIPRVARIISVADTYDAMVSTRPYRKGMDPLLAYDEITRYRGTQFDPAVVDAFQKAFLNEKMGKGSGGSSFSGSGGPTETESEGGGHFGSETNALSNCD